MDAGDQLIAVERLGHIIVGAEAQCADFAVHLADAGQDQHRGRDLGHPQLLQHVIAVHVRQVQVETDDVVIVELAEIEALFAKIGGVDVEAFGAEHQLDALGRRRLVLNQQHAHCWSPRFRPRALTALNGLEAIINHSRSEGKRLIFCNRLDSLSSLQRSHKVVHRR